MKKFRFKHALLLIVIVVLLIAGVCGLWVRAQQNQYALNRQLIAALVKNDLSAALQFVNEGADPNTSSEPLPAPSLKQFLTYLMHRAPRPVNNSPTAFLMACGNDAELSDLPDGKDRAESPQLTQAMIRHGANANARDKDGKTPLYWASHSDYMKTIGVLLEAGGDVNAKSHQGWTPLMIACCGSSTDTIRLLLAHGAEVNILDNDGSTALCNAVKYAHSEEDPTEDSSALKILLDHGASPDLTAKGSRTALQEARAKNRPDIVLLLQQAGAKR